MTYKVVGIGEVLWDLLPRGNQMGGAPANFACHAASLGAQSSLVSRVGQDELGNEALRQLRARKVSVQGVERDRLCPTGTVNVTVGSDGQALYCFPEHVAWDEIICDASTNSVVTEADAICFGTLAQRREPSRSAIRQLVASARPSALRVFDVNLRQNFYSPEIIEESLRMANVVKLNDSELTHISQVLQLKGTAREQMAALADRFGLRLVALTRGQYGSLLYAGDKWSENPGVQTQIVDTIGAGDSFTAAMTLGFLANWHLDKIGINANRVASFVCSRPGATPELPEELRGLFRI